MSVRFQTLRDTKAINDAFIGPVGQVTIDTDTRNLRLHNNVNAGGFRVSGPAVVEQVSTGTSHTVVIKGAETLVVWTSVTAGDKDTVLPAAAAANDGCKVTVATTLSNGDNHTITPASGTIQGDSAFAFTDNPRGAVTLISDGTNTDWIIT